MQGGARPETQNLFWNGLPHDDGKLARGGDLGPWNILIVDDDPDVHSIIKLILRDAAYLGRPLHFHSAYSAKQAEALLAEQDDIAVAFLDVVMETEEAGLQLVRRIREDMQNAAIRVILITGQPGQAPERDVIVNYDINDYKTKIDLTAQKLFTTIIASLRSYTEIMQRQSIEQDLLAALGRIQLANLALDKLAQSNHRLAEQRTHDFEQSELRFQTLAHVTTDAIVVADSSGSVVMWNMGAERVLGYAPCQIIGSPLSTVIPEAEGKSLGELAPTNGAEPAVVREMSGRSIDGSEIPIEVSFTQSRIAGKDYVTAIVRDITARRRIQMDLETARDAAEQASQAKSSFLATISHEIRTPMNGVIGMSGLLLDTDLSTEQRSMVEAIRDSGDALLRIVNEILDFSKIEAGRLELEEADYELVQLIESAVEMHAPTAQTKGIELALVVEPTVPRSCFGDSGRVRQVIMNLLSNAIKFTDTGGVTVQVGTLPADERGARLKVEVVDTGIGIPAQAQEKLFQDFVQIDGSDARRYGGSGLGLAISRRLTEMMGGAIGVESEPGQGSRFWFEVPLRKAGGDAYGPGADCALDRLKGLVVNGSRIGSGALREQLARWGVDVVDVDRVADAPSALDRQPADFVVVGTDGLRDQGGIARIRDHSGCGKLIACVSSSAGEAFAGAPFDAVLRKPVKPSSLFDALATALGPERMSSPMHPAARQIETPAAKDATEEPMRILVAEDNPVNQLVARRILEARGHRVDIVSNGAEAVEAVATLPYDLVLMDIQMPDVDGLEATRRIRRLDGAPATVPIVAMTANVLDGIITTCRAAGMNDYIAKPINRTALAELLLRFGEPRREAAGTKAAPSPMNDGAADAEAMIDPQMIDRQTIDTLLESFDGREIAVMLQRFKDDIDIRLAAIEQHLQSHDGASLAEQAHGFKAAAGAIGLAEVQRLGAALERAGLDSDWAGIGTLLGTLNARLAGGLAAAATYVGQVG